MQARSLGFFPWLFNFEHLWYLTLFSLSAKYACDQQYVQTNMLTATQRNIKKNTYKKKLHNPFCNIKILLRILHLYILNLYFIPNRIFLNLLKLTIIWYLVTLCSVYDVHAKICHYKSCIRNKNYAYFMNWYVIICDRNLWLTRILKT